MATAVKMPQLGMTMTEAKVVEWLKQEGDTVQKGEPVATIETDKLNAEVEASADGILRRIVAPAGSTVPVVGLMAIIAAADEPDSAVEAVVGGDASRGRGAAAAENQGAATQPGEVQRPADANISVGAQHAAPLRAAVEAAAPPADVRASPIAKRLASDLGVDLGSLQGTGPGGRIVEADVRRAAPTAPAVATNGYVRASPIAKRLARESGIELQRLRGSGPEGRVVERDVLAALEMRQRTAPAVATPAGLTPREAIPLDGMRRIIAERMHASLQQMAQLTLTAEADATALVELRSHLVPAARVYGHRAPTYTDLIVAIVARVLRDHPLLNASLVGETGSQEVVCWQEINVGVAVALERGLVVPVIRGADQKPLQQVSEELADLAERARANRLSMDDLQGGTFTVSNLGQVEVDGFTPIVNPPQCAILGVGRIAKKPAVYQDQLAVRHLVTLSLSFDHRVVDGFPAGAFLRDVKRAIEEAKIGD